MVVIVCRPRVSVRLSRSGGDAFVFRSWPLLVGVMVLVVVVGMGMVGVVGFVSIRHKLVDTLLLLSRRPLWRPVRRRGRGPHLLGADLALARRAWQ